jgi:carbonic anhydrase
MKLALLTTACVVAAIALPASARASAATPNWSYKTNDPTIAGPAKWGDVNPTCGGKRQSPINIDIVADADEEMPIEFGGTCGQYNISQQYDALKVEVQGGMTLFRLLCLLYGVAL